VDLPSEAAKQQSLSLNSLLAEQSTTPGTLETVMAVVRLTTGITSAYVRCRTLFDPLPDNRGWPIGGGNAAVCAANDGTRILSSDNSRRERLLQ
jgi:hypothetical protein